MGEKRGTHLVGEAKESAEELGEVHLARGELATATEVGAVEGRDRVDDEEGEPVPRKRDVQLLSFKRGTRGQTETRPSSRRPG